MSFSPAVATYRKMHESGCFVLPNPWDVGTALYLRHLGFKALATTSAGMAFAHGLPDDTGAVPIEVALEHIRELAAATGLPINADFQNGYADEPEGVARNVARCVATGAAGLSIEDSTGKADSPLYERALAIERIRAARRAIDQGGSGVVLTARCEAALLRLPDGARTALDRLVAFAEAGADCLYAPGINDAATVASIVKAVAPKPVNVLIWAPGPGLNVAALAALGVRRISVGGALARVAWGAFIRAARQMAQEGSFEGLAGGAPYKELNDLFRR